MIDTQAQLRELWTCSKDQPLLEKLQGYLSAACVFLKFSRQLNANGPQRRLAGCCTIPKSQCSAATQRLDHSDIARPSSAAHVGYMAESGHSLRQGLDIGISSAEEGLHLRAR
jgi:hypothetical protein